MNGRNECRKPSRGEGFFKESTCFVKWSTDWTHTLVLSRQPLFEDFGLDPPLSHLGFDGRKLTLVERHRQLGSSDSEGSDLLLTSGVSTHSPFEGTPRETFTDEGNPPTPHCPLLAGG